MNDTSMGLFLLLIAGVANASFTLPMKFARKWAWENTWFVFSVFSLCVIPPLVSFLTVPELDFTYSEVGNRVIALVAACGFGWGFSQVFFGLAVDAIGIALAFSIILGLSAAVGSIIPLIRLHPEKIFSTVGVGVLVGVGLVILGVAISAVAGRRRERAQGTGANQGSMTRGLILAFLSGLGAALVNFGLAFGGPLLETAQHHGASQLWAPNAVWLPLMLAGAFPNLLYCLYLLKQRGTFGKFAAAGSSSHWVLALLMAVFWFGSTSLYGISTQKLGSWGTILGWPLFMSLIVITATILGVVTGEWKGAGKGPLRIQMAGVAVLVLAVFVLAAASRYV